MSDFACQGQFLSGPPPGMRRASRNWKLVFQSRHSRHPAAAAITRASIPGPIYLSSSSSDRTRLNAGNQYSNSFIPFPLRENDNTKNTPPLVRVRLSVEYRVHSRQMLCVGGSAIPFGWSFLSIAKVPMSWQPTDIWTVDVELPAGARVEYKYVILEEQDWTRQVNEAVEGRVEYHYRSEPDISPPDVQRITKQMAIVAWQAGSNRVLQVPREAELVELKANGITEMDRPLGPPPGGAGGSRLYGQQALGKDRGYSSGGSSSEEQDPAAFAAATTAAAAGPSPVLSEQNGIWERLTIDEVGRPLLERRDAWGRGEWPSRG